MGKDQTPENIGSCTAGHPSDITVDENTVEQVDNFTYLGSTQSSNGGSQVDIKRRIALASSILLLSCLERPIPLFANEDSGISDPCFTCSSLRL